MWSGPGEPSKVSGVTEIAIHLVAAAKLPQAWRRPLAAALVGIASAAILMIAVSFTKGSTPTLPEQIRSQPEMSQNETGGIRSRPVRTLTVLGRPEERPSVAEAQTSQGSPVSQSDLDRAKAELQRRLQQPSEASGDDRNLFVSPVSQPGSVRERPAVVRPVDPPTPANTVSTEQLATREGTSAASTQPTHGSSGPNQGTEERASGPRVVIHWPKHNDRSAELAKDLAEDFRQKGWAATALKSVGRSIRHIEVRYPDRDARSSAIQVKSELSRSLRKNGGLGSMLRLRRKTTENSVIEVWLPKSVR